MNGGPPAPDGPQRVAVDGGVVWQMVDGQVVLLTLARGRYFRLDEVGSRMWELLDECHEVGVALQRLQAEFEVDAATLRDDLAAFIRTLVDAGLLSVQA